MTLPLSPVFGPQTARDLDREVLLTDGLGGFSMSSLAGAPTRSYSGLAVSHQPPVDRRVMFITPLETLDVAGRTATLHAFEVAPGTLEGDGLHTLESVVLQGLLPLRTQVAHGVRVQRRAFMPRHAGTLVLLYDVDAREEVTLTLGGLFTDRDMHAVCPQAPTLTFSVQGPHATIQGTHTLQMHVHAPGGTVTALFPAPYTQRLHYRQEAARGEADTDRALGATLFQVTLPAGGGRVALVVDGLEEGALDPWGAWEAEVSRRSGLVRTAQATTGLRDEDTAHLTLAADAYLVRRASVDSVSVIAGYPWFADWGRDSMIALSGLLLTTGRFTEARGLLETFLRYAQRGLVPNNFYDDGSGAGYNTVDGSLWLFQAFERYVHASGDEAFARAHLPALRAILQHHVDGTDFGIGVDARDGLLRAGAPRVQLTWMDVRIEDWVVTPRHGKPVEINALWIGALAVEGRLSARLGEAAQFGTALTRAQASFAAFWNADAGFPYDVLHDDGTADAAIRPNALLALALPDTPATAEQLDAALRVAETHLLTPLGLRTLSPEDAAYRGAYGGHRLVRDAAYHQGTVWPWPLGAYVTLLLRRGDVVRARWALAGLRAHLWEAGVGGVSEVFAGTTLAPGGCPFQAWSVAEVLRAHVAVSRH
ncbi:amylo-alpha-1,6-glucosidase [Deinococcus maricopensis]|uniref:4-alpha-glucanotransferase n=1 Tax=Deinococcus maricopensis (strain DSM 21211 / LMG 22137 / NRRL B-23946 / LB-34) TaxID=709986 RepID=E8UBK1_DEIML|nr:amylo-alpha-1,6-glucosidase [Deinococcus maricopensis]ADV68440.1 4-alpha-glucanotransferase [Deinococcus maricopensis DSM 21211]